MNRDEGAFLLSHVYDDLLLHAATTAVIGLEPDPVIFVSSGVNKAHHGFW